MTPSGKRREIGLGPVTGVSMERASDGASGIKERKVFKLI
jgi:hypothetical protein